MLNHEKKSDLTTNVNKNGELPVQPFDLNTTSTQTHTESFLTML